MIYFFFSVGKGKKASDGRIYDLKNLKESDIVTIRVAVFDVLYFNNNSLLDIKFEERIQYLYDNSIFSSTDEEFIFISMFTKIYSRLLIMVLSTSSPWVTLVSLVTLSPKLIRFDSLQE